MLTETHDMPAPSTGIQADDVVRIVEKHDGHRGALIAILHQRQTDERGKVVENFGRFDSKDVQDMFRRLFKAQGSHA